MVSVVDFPAALRTRRKQQNYSQETLAHALGLTASAVAQWEQGRTTPQSKTARQLDDLLNADGAILDSLGLLGQPAEVAELRAEVATRFDAMTALQRELAEQVHEVLTLLRDVAVEVRHLRAATESPKSTARSRR